MINVVCNFDKLHLLTFDMEIIIFAFANDVVVHDDVRFVCLVQTLYSSFLHEHNALISRYCHFR